MARFTLELYLDGYDTEEEMIAACKEFIFDQLNFAGSGVGCIEHIPDPPEPDGTPVSHLEGLAP